MTKKQINLRFFLVFSIFLLTMFGLHQTLAQSTINYIESDEVIANPERGLQKYSITNNNYNTQNNYSSLSQSTLSGWRTSSDRVTVLFRYFLLNNFLNSDISERYLNNMQKDFDIIRNSGLKCLVRFSYSNGITDNPQQPTKAQILTHLEQLTPLLETNKDVIVAHQAGLIGTWGEWYYTRSEEFGDEGKMNNTQWSNRKDVVDAMLAATPAEIPLQVRYPDAKKKMYGTSQLDETTAYKNTPNARIGFYNDAFLNAWGDMGTYGGGQTQNPVGSANYNYLANETKYTPMTGETNGVNEPRTNADNAIYEMGLTHWTCINRDYHKDVWNIWINANSYNDILKKTGYRFVLKNSTFQLVDNNLHIEINIENKGFARLFKERKAYLVLKNSSNNQIYSFLVDSDPRTWETNVQIIETIDISSLPQGSYNTFLYLPDISVSLANRSEYAIRFANTETWDVSTGYNNLNQVVIKAVTSSLKEMHISRKMQISPNPFTTQTTIILNDKLNNGKMTLLNANGQIMYESFNLNGHIFSLHKHNLSEGVYMIICDDKDRYFLNKLIIY